MKNLFFIILILFCNHLFAQNPSDRLKIMVVPYVTSEESIKTKIDTSEMYRIAINKVTNELENYGYTVVDYMEWRAKIKRNNEISKLDGDPVLQAIRYAPADVFINVELFLKEYPPKESQLRMLLFANDKYSAERYATSDLMYSSRRQWPDFTYPLNRLSLEEGEGEWKGFFQKLDTKLKKVVKEGRKVEVQVEKVKNSKAVFDETIRAKTKDFVKKFAVDGYIQVSGDDHLLIMELKVSILTTSPADIGDQLKAFLTKELTPAGTKVTTQYLSGQINITIQ